MNKFDSVSSSFTIGTLAIMFSHDHVQDNLESLYYNFLTIFIEFLSNPGTQTTRSISDIGK